MSAKPTSDETRAKPHDKVEVKIELGPEFKEQNPFMMPLDTDGRYAVFYDRGFDIIQVDIDQVKASMSEVKFSQRMTEVP